MIESGTTERFRENLRGRLIEPDDPDFDDARAVWNGLIDRRPAAIARCAGTADVVTAVDHARESGSTVTARSGGHDYAGDAVGGGSILIDLSSMNGIWIDPERRRARVQAGARWRAFDHEAQAFGLATTGATVSTVGVAGFTLGGGTGYLARKHGLGLDNLLSVDVVTAGGDHVHASDDEEPDLFWGMRGGRGNLGIATSFEFALHEVGPEVLAGQIVHRFEDAGNVLRFYREFMSEAPDEIQGYAFILRIPPLDAFPEKFHGKVALDLVVFHAGEVATGEEALRPLREFGDPILDAVVPQPYTAVQRAFDEGTPSGQRWYSRAHYLDSLSDDAIDTVLRYTESLPGTFTIVYFEPMTGAIQRVDPGATAFPHRTAGYSFHALPGWTDPAEDEAIIEWARQFHAAMAEHATGGVYVNLLGPDEEERVEAAYGDHYRRLARLKGEYDPTNLFRTDYAIGSGG